VETDSYGSYKRYSSRVSSLPPINLRDLLDFAPKSAPINVDEVESITQIRKMLGRRASRWAPEAHETCRSR
jgi:glutamate synthase (NADPH/NADH) large chain